MNISHNTKKNNKVKMQNINPPTRFTFKPKQPDGTAVENSEKRVRFERTNVNPDKKRSHRPFFITGDDTDINFRATKPVPNLERIISRAKNEPNEQRAMKSNFVQQFKNLSKNKAIKSMNRDSDDSDESSSSDSGREVYM